MRRLIPKVYLSHTALIIEGSKYLSVIDPGFDYTNGKKGEGPSSLERVFELSERLDRPVHYIFITHSHIDHIYNTRKYLEKFPDTLCIGHMKGPYINNLKKEGISVFRVQGNMVKTIDGIKYILISTPGHSKQGDDMSVYIPDKRLVQVGDLFQPQGSTYADSDGVSPVPYFHQGDNYIESIEKIKDKNFDFLVTGHGEFLKREAGMKGLELTKHILERMGDLAIRMVSEHPDMDDMMLCEWIYDTIVYERNFNKIQAEMRKGQGKKNGSHYRRFDLPGVQYFVKTARIKLRDP